MYRRKNWVAAIAEFENALRIEPEQYRAQLLLAVCQLQIFKYDQAKANLTACLQRDPNTISLHLLRGFAYGEEGYARLKMAREANPRLVALEAEAEAQFESAEADYRDAMALKPDPSDLYALLVNRGALRLRRHRLDDAVSDFTQAISLKPDQIAAYITLGQAYRRQGRVEEAIEQFTRGIELKPEMAGLYRSRALARLDRGRPSPEGIEESIRRPHRGDPARPAWRPRIRRRPRPPRPLAAPRRPLRGSPRRLRGAPSGPSPTTPTPCCSASARCKS